MSKQITNYKLNKPETDYMKEKIEKEIPLDQYHKWYADEHSKQMPDVSNLSTTNYSEGAIKRISTISSLKYLININMIHGSIVVFKLYDNNVRKEVNYAMVFCENINDIPENSTKNINPSRIIGHIVMHYYSASSSFISCDGEYRTKLVRYDSITTVKLLYPDIWFELDQYVTQIVKQRRWFLSASYFHGRENKSDIFEIEKAIRYDLIPHIMLILSWCNTVYNEMLGITESHMNPTYKEIFLRESSIDIEFMKDLIKKHGKENLEKFIMTISTVTHPIYGKNEVRWVPIGYKMIPLNIRELQDPLRLKYKPWREYMIATKCNDLVVNQIAPGFPITLDWFLIKNSSKGLFDNKSQYERLKHSELAKDILNTLYEAQRSTYFATSDLGKSMKSSDIKKWISNKFRRLSDKIYEPINYSIEEIVMSNVTIAFPSEFVGRTTADTINLIKSSKTYNEHIGMPMTNYNIFAKYVFEICYNLLTINKKLSVIHGDFHLNNSTIGFLYKSDPESKVVYCLDKDTKYIFPNNGYFSCIIDFSRALIDPENYKVLIDLSLPESFKPIKDYDKFALNESNNLLNLYLLLFPGKSKQKEELLVLFKNNYKAVFKLLTCIDLYMYTIRMSMMLKQQLYKVDKICMELIDKINKLSEIYITTEMNHIMTNPEHAKKIESNEWPIETIIRKCFSEFIDGKVYKKIGIITDCYSLDNEMKYSISKYELFPTVIKQAFYYIDNKILPIEYINKQRELRRMDYEKRRIHMLEHLKVIVNKIAME